MGGEGNWDGRKREMKGVQTRLRDENGIGLGKLEDEGGKVD